MNEEFCSLSGPAHDVGVEVSAEKRITVKSRTSSRFSVQRSSATNVYGGVCASQQLMPRPVQWSGTIRKYLSMASQKRARYSSGETTVGILPEDMTQRRNIRSSFTNLLCTELMTSNNVPACYFPESMKTWRNVSNEQHQSRSSFGVNK